MANGEAALKSTLGRRSRRGGRKVSERGKAERTHYTAIVLLFIAVLFGGSGSRAPILVTSIELLAVVGLLVALWRYSDRPVDKSARGALILMGLIALTPVLQLVPLPPSLWQLLPGRELATEITALIGAGDLWRPITLDPNATLETGLEMIVGIAFFLIALVATQRERDLMTRVVILVALLSTVLGVLQLAGGSDSIFYPFATTHDEYPVGIFTNRNHQADFLVVAVLLTAAAASYRRPRPIIGPAMAWGLIALFSVAVIATNSRTGLLLLLGALVVACSFMFDLKREVGRRWRMLTAIAVGLLATVLLVLATDVGQRGLERFNDVEDARFEFWPDVLKATGQYFPIGSGIGTFVPVYESVEKLDNVTPAYVNHAHSDYLELVLETGLWGAILIIAFMVFLYRRMRGSASSRSDIVRQAAGWAILVLLAHSTVDYPLRATSLMALFGFLVALLFAPAGSGAGTDRQR